MTDSSATDPNATDGAPGAGLFDAGGGIGPGLPPGFLPVFDLLRDRVRSDAAPDHAAPSHAASATVAPASSATMTAAAVPAAAMTQATAAVAPTAVPTAAAPDGLAAMPASLAVRTGAAASGPTVLDVSTEAQLNQAIATVDGASSGSYEILFAPGATITENTDTAASSTFEGHTLADPGQLFAFNLASGVAVTVDGNGGALSGAGVDPGLFVYAGDVTVENLTIENTVATGGGGSFGGGGGGGLGGGVFVATSGDVTLDGVTFSHDGAVGGAGGSNAGGYAGGGGGLGGEGEAGGGGVGLGADGFSSEGIVLGAAPGGASLSGAGGAYGGGGGTGGGPANTGSGGGGVGGGSGIGQTNGGNGGFGGGAGGGVSGGGKGGFGGGGGGSFDANAPGGAGGFGGGGGAGNGAHGGQGGFGAGSGDSTGSGGGGIGAGADVFVQQGGTLTIGSGSLGAGTVTGGASGGGSAAAGGADGTGLFLQGGETVTLGASGQSLTVAGTIADQTGSGGAGTNAGAGTLDIAAGSRVTLDAADTYTGGTVLGSGSTLTLGNLQAAGSGAITLNGDGDDLVLTSTVSNVIDGFADSDELDLAYVPFSEVDGYGYDFQNGQLDVTERSGQTFYFNVPGVSVDEFNGISITADANGGTIVEAPCFVLGTSLDTPDGAVRVENLQPGDVVTTLTGPARVRWIGHHRSSDVDVIRIRPHALGQNQPRHDLYVSDDHAMFLDGVLVPAGLLANGCSIVAERRESVVFFHVELEAHAVLLAEGAPAESYIDTGNRRQFGNCPIGYDPVSATQDHCAELVVAGVRLARIRAGLASVPA